MADETTSQEDLEKDNTPKEQQFRFKPAWQRLIIMAGGVSVNLVLAMIIYTGLFGIYGEEYLPNKNLTNGIMVIDSIGYQLGLQDGDKLIALDGNPIDKFDNFQKEMLFSQAQKLEIERNGQRKTLEISKEFLGALIQKRKMQIILPAFPFLIDSTITQMPAAKAGFVHGDKILRVNETATPKYSDVTKAIQSFANQEISITVEREKQPVELKVTPDSSAKIGIIPIIDYKKLYNVETIRFGFWGTIAKGVKEPFIKINDYWKSLQLLTLPKVEVKDNLGGFYSMGKIMPTTWDWRAFWTITAFISVILAVMNILPIPMLDGGYIMFLFYEMIVGKPLPDKIQNVLQYVGLIIILGLMLLANGLDIIRGIFG
jgi:regulator of sigma E protease